MIECGGNADHISLIGSYKTILTSLEADGTTAIEDAYRYTDQKWGKTNFDHIDAYYVNNEISCISGVMQYGEWMKGAVYHYNLKKYSVHNRTLFFSDGGMLDRLADYAKQQNKLGVFISIWPHEPKLSALCKRLKENRSIPTTGNLSKIRSMIYQGTTEIQGVPQDVFALSFTAEQLDLDSLKSQ